MALPGHVRTLLLAGTLLMTSRAGAQDPSSTPGERALVSEIRALVEAEAAADRFSGVVLVAREGVPLVTVAVGLADRERGLPITPDTRFNLASGDKLFTKIAILQLVQAGRVALSDTVGRFLPGYVNGTVRRSVTVEHLLGHRSGLGAYWGETFQRERTRIRELEDLVPLFEGEEPAFPPGTRMLYSNSGYVLLGRIVEVVAGQSYRDYLLDHVFGPAGMSSTAYLTIEEWPADKAVGYSGSDSLAAPGTGEVGGAAGERTPNDWSLAFRGSAAGGGYSTAGDLLALDRALRRGALLDTTSLGRFTVTGPDGGRMLANGGGPGANFEFVRAGDHTILVLSNYDPPAATRLRQRLSALLGERNKRVRGEIERLNRSMMEAWGLGDAAALAEHGSEEARLIGSTGRVLEGGGGRHRYWQSLPMRDGTWTLEVPEAGGSPDLAYQLGAGRTQSTTAKPATTI